MLRLFGAGFTDKTEIGLTSEKLEYGGTCHMILTGFFQLSLESSTNALVEVLLPKNSVELYFCASNNNDSVSLVICLSQVSNFTFQIYHHQGTDPWMSLKSNEPFLPTWVQFMIIVVCLCFSALFSGLNLGLMSLDRTDLKVSID